MGPGERALNQVLKFVGRGRRAYEENMREKRYSSCYDARTLLVGIAMNPDAPRMGGEEVKNWVKKVSSFLRYEGSQFPFDEDLSDAKD